MTKEEEDEKDSLHHTFYTREQWYGKGEKMDEKDELDAEKWWDEDFNLRKQILTLKQAVVTGFVEGRRTLREKQKIGRFRVSRKMSPDFGDFQNGVGQGNIINPDFHGFTEYQGPGRWVSVDDCTGPAYNLFVCNRCRQFRFWSRIYGEFPIIAPMVGIDPYMEARMISKLHREHFCHAEEEIAKEE